MAIAAKCTCGHSLTGVCASSVKECRQLKKENTQLPKEVVEEINRGGQEMLAYKCDNKASYIVGATVYATAYAKRLNEANETIKILTYDNNRLKGEVTQVEKANSELLCEYNEANKLLTEVFHKHESGLLPDRFIYDKIKKFLYGE